MTEPRRKPGRSKQDYGTQWSFIRAVEERFGDLTVDLAATYDNAKNANFISAEQNSLTVDWRAQSHGVAWLNPPFSNIAPWAERCALFAPVYAAAGGRILFLTPASVGAEWFANHVFGKALVLGLRGRLTFEGCEPNPRTGKVEPYPKDCILSVFGAAAGFDLWDWRRQGK